VDVNPYQLLFEVALGALCGVLGLYFRSQLNDLKERAVKNRADISSLETTMVKDVATLQSLADAVREHTSREQVYWQKIDNMVISNERAHADIRERLARLEPRIKTVGGLDA
jgi:predicted  nucleic acid-binding Zn-ribbon protein